MGFLHSMAKVLGYGFQAQLENMAKEMRLGLTWCDDDMAYARIGCNGEDYMVIFSNIEKFLAVIVPSNVKFRPGRVPIWLTSEMLKGNETRDWGRWQVTDGEDDSHLSLTLRFERAKVKTDGLMEMMHEMIGEVFDLDEKLKTM